MTGLLATTEDLLARLDWELDATELRIATAALEDLSDMARHYGVSSWTSVTAPRAVRTLVLRAAQRFMRNPDGYIQSRAGDEIVGWAPNKSNVGAPAFTDAELEELKDLGKRIGGLMTVRTYVYSNTQVDPTACGHVPVHYHGQDFRFFA